MMESERAFYRNHLLVQVLPFWEAAFDEEYGGLFTCYSNDGETLVSTDKYIWSQGRMLWLLSYMLDHEVLNEEQTKRATARAEQLYTFLHANVLLPGVDEGTAFVLTREGVPKEPVAGEGYYTSFYADCFVIVGFSRWAAHIQDREIITEAVALYEKMLGILERGIVKTEPYALGEGSRTQAVEMILINTEMELAASLKTFDKELNTKIRARAKERSLAFFDTFIDTERMQVREVVDDSNERSLLSRHRNPGHTVELIWFLLDALEGERGEELETLLLNALELGWDTTYGGLLRYVDCDGEEPRGEKGSDAFSHLVASTWEYKLWWPHAEALWALWRIMQERENPALKAWYERIKEYTFTTFPSPKEGREWIQIRKRDGTPEDRVIALPVKDPYHIMRTLLFFTTDRGRDI